MSDTKLRFISWGAQGSLATTQFSFDATAWGRTYRNWASYIARPGSIGRVAERQCSPWWAEASPPDTVVSGSLHDGDNHDGDAPWWW
jgi:hypothetical protein